MKDEGSHVADEMDMKRNSRPLHGCWALGTTGNTGALPKQRCFCSRIRLHFIDKVLKQKDKTRQIFKK